MSHAQNLQHAVMAAKAGNPSLARVHLHKAAEEAPDDPAVWLWMGWLSESPVSMVQCLEAAMQDERHRNIAQAGLAFARALCAYRVVPVGSAVAVGTARSRDTATRNPEARNPEAPKSAGPIELVEQLAADVARVDHASEPGELLQTPARPTIPATPSDWDPNGLTPPPLPPEACRPAQPVRPSSTTSAPADVTAHDQVPPLPRETPAHAQILAQAPSLQHRSEAAAQNPIASQSDHGLAPVWRAASLDWFTVDSTASHRHETDTLGGSTTVPPPPSAQQQVPTTNDIWSQPATPPVTPAVQPAPAVRPQVSTYRPAEWLDDAPHGSLSDSPAVEKQAVIPDRVAPADQTAVPQLAGSSFKTDGAASFENAETAAAQLDAELERRQVDVDVETADAPAQTAAETVQTDESSVAKVDQTSRPAPQTSTPQTHFEPWRPSGIDQRALPLYESPALKPAYAMSPETDRPAAAGFSGPSFEGEPLKPATHPRTVLVVDDSPTVRKLVAMTLEKNGYRVVSAFDGVAAIREIAEHNPALILMDVNMPRMDGYQLCKLVRKHEATRHIPVLMLSGKDGVFDRLRGRMVGCSGYVPKPFVPEELVQAVGEHIDAAAR